MKPLSFFLSIWALFISFSLNAQDNAIDNLPSYIPPSPELSNLRTSLVSSARNITGAANVNVPLYQITAGEISLQLSLNYSTNGIKVTDVPSRVGLGWNLNAGGVIAKVVHDEEDDNILTQKLDMPTGGYNQNFLNFLALANSENYDTERDEYSFSFNGVSGQFFVDDNGQVQQANKSDLRIVKFGAYAFEITNGQGIKYYFGDFLERTTEVKLNGAIRGNKTKTTGFFLRRITSPKGDVISFSYSPIHIRTHLGVAQSAVLRRNYVYNQNPNYSCGVCQGSDLRLNTAYNQIDYDTYFIDEISTNRGTGIYFTYEGRGDGGGDNRLASLSIFSHISNSASHQLKKYRFEYDDFPLAQDPLKRFYLSRIIDIPINVTSIDPIDVTPSDLTLGSAIHSFEYNDPSALPSRYAFGQDFFGYPNGVTSNQHFFPKPEDPTSYQYGDFGANREPNPTWTLKGSLKKITFPTGGSEEFIYENHTLKKTNRDSTFSHEFLYKSGLALNTANVLVQNFTIQNIHGLVRIDMITHQNPQGPTFGQPNYWAAGGGKTISILKIMTTSGEQVFFLKHTEMRNDFVFLNLQLNTTYQATLTVYGSTYRCDVDIRYNTVIQETLTNKIGCGIRVKKIRSFDPVTNKHHSKYYTYTKIEEITNGRFISSGIGEIRTANSDFYPLGAVCIRGGVGIGLPYQVVDKCPNMIKVSSSSVSGHQGYNGSPIAYQYIIESDDERYYNGCTETNYYLTPNENNILTILNYPARQQAGFGDLLQGKEQKINLFKRVNNGFILLQKQEFTYSGDSRIGSITRCYKTTKRWTPPNVSNNVSMEDMLAGYDIGGYDLRGGWVHLDSKTTTNFDENGENGIVSTENYKYNNLVNGLPTTIKYTNSQGQEILLNRKYPSDYNGNPTMDGMVARNSISKVVEQTSYKDRQLTETLFNAYGLSVNHGSNLYYPIIKKQAAKANGNLLTKALFEKFDDDGNPSIVYKEDGLYTFYLWNYFGSLPVAELKSTAPDDFLAYTSFEGNSTGGWNFNPTGIISNRGITGRKCYSGTASVTIPSPMPMVLTAWAEAEIEVNGNTGLLLATKGTWKLYKWDIDAVMNVQVVGNFIDEVRLYPRDGMLSTYTYLPGVGITSTCNENNDIVYYKYDAFNRLTAIRDVEGNIIKKYEYNYGSSIVACPNVAAQWTPTGLRRCVTNQSHTGNNNLTGAQEFEERDENNCSSTYLNTRWVNNPNVPVGECVPIPNCTGPDKRVVNGQCETASKILISSATNSTGGFDCTYIYQWSDQFQSQPFIVHSVNPCGIIYIVY